MDDTPAQSLIEQACEPPDRIRLTERQGEVLILLCAGMPNKVISRKLRISAATVKVHVSGVLRALGCGTRLQAVIKARALGLVSRSGTLEQSAVVVYVSSSDRTTAHRNRATRGS